MRLKNMVGSFVIFYVLVILVVGVWDGFKAGYTIVDQETQDGLNIFEQLSSLNLIEGINDLTIGITGLTKISNPADLLGALALSALGTLQLIGGIVTFPLEIVGIITGFYGALIPPIVGQLLGFLVVLGVGFILLSAKLGYEL